MVERSFLAGSQSITASVPPMLLEAIAGCLRIDAFYKRHPQLRLKSMYKANVLFYLPWPVLRCVTSA